MQSGSLQSPQYKEADRRDQVPAKELRKKLLGNLQDNGVIDALKAQLRYQVLSQIKADQSAKQALIPEARTSPSEMPHGPLHQRALNCLIAEYMQARSLYLRLKSLRPIAGQACGYHYSMSVFLPESGITNANHSRQELLEMCAIAVV